MTTMKAQDLWDICEANGLLFFSRGNRQFWKTKLTRRPRRTDTGLIVFATSDTMFGVTHITQHTIDLSTGKAIHTKEINT